MSSRPTNGRIRPTHSIAGSLAIGVTIVAFAIILFVVLGGAQP